MFDSNVISFAHGEGMRRPTRRVVASTVLCLLNRRDTAFETYRFLERSYGLEAAVEQAFASQGIYEGIRKNICFDSGTTRLFQGFLWATSTPGDVFLVAPGYYHALAGWCNLFQVTLSVLRSRAETQYKLSREVLEEWWTSHPFERKRVRGVIVFNPTYLGGLFEDTEIQDVARFATEKRLYVIEDAIFAATVYRDTPYRSFLGALPELSDRIVVLDGGSKAYGLANLRIGWACGDKNLIGRLNEFMLTTTATVPHVAKRAALAALRSSRRYLRRNAAEAHRRSVLINQLIVHSNQAVANVLSAKPKEELLRVVFQPSAGHSILLSANGLRGLRNLRGEVLRDSIDVTRSFLDECQVAFAPGLSHGFDDCYLRATFGCVGFESGFAAGRQKIRSAFIDRIIPYLTEIASRNARRVTH